MDPGIQPSRVWLERLADYQIPDEDREDFENPYRFAHRLCNDFGFFLRAVWIDRGLYKVAPLSWFELDLSHFMAYGPRRRVIPAFRGEGKTHEVAGLCCFRYLRDPKRQIIVISKSEGATKKTLHLVRGWLESIWFLQHLCPQVGQRDAATYFDVGELAGMDETNRQQSMFAIGIGGQLENNRAHTIIGDDIETKGNSRTIESRTEVRRLWGEAELVLYPNRAFEDGGPVDPTEIVVIGTPKHEETIYLDMISEGYACQGYPIAYPTEKEKVIGLAPILQAMMDQGLAKPGEPTCPHRFGYEELEMRRSKGYTEFARESMLIADLAESNTHPLRLRDMIIHPVHRDIAPLRIAWGTANSNGSTAIPHTEIPSLGLGDDRLYHPIHVEQQGWTEYVGTRAGIDPAGRGTDRTGLAICSQLAGMFWFKAVLGLKGGMGPDELENIAGILREHDATSVLMESNVDITGTIQSVLQIAIQRLAVRPGEDSRFPKGWTCQVERVHASGQKEVRVIETIEPLLSTHRLVFDPSCVTPAKPYVQENDLQWQLTRITKQLKCLPEDGKLDAIALALRAWEASTRLDPSISAARNEKANLTDQLKKVYAAFKVPATDSICTKPTAHRRGSARRVRS